MPYHVVALTMAQVRQGGLAFQRELGTALRESPDLKVYAVNPFDLDERQRRILVLVLVVHVILARLTLRDLRRRPVSAVRGPKRLWRIWATTNTTGSAAYWLVGRRREPTA